jgi:arginase
MNVGPVARSAKAIADRVRWARAANRMPVILGGDCTIELGVVLGFADLDARPGLVYFDPHPDLNTPETVTDGALDWMGVAHLLSVPGAVERLAALGPRQPLLEPRALLLFGASEERTQPQERVVIDRLGLDVISEAQVAGDPARAAADALHRLAGRADSYLVHFDVDAVDFADAPLSENTDRNVGLTYGTALSAFRELARGPNLAGVTVTELNPHHATAADGLLGRFASDLATAIAEGPSR